MREPAQADSWERMFAALVAFRAAHGHCDVPKRWKEDPRLGEWVLRQRRVRKQRKLSAERERLLETLGFSWSVVGKEPAHLWEAMFEALAAFERRFGHCDVPPQWAEDRTLGAWVARQRRAYAQGRLASERAARLVQLGMSFAARDREWDDCFARLTRYKHAHGHCDVPRGWVEDPELAAWVERQRRQEQLGTLPLHHKRRLMALGLELGSRLEGGAARPEAPPWTLPKRGLAGGPRLIGGG